MRLESMLSGYPCDRATRAAGRTGVVLAVLVLAATAACGHVRLISPYDEQTDKGVTELARAVGSLLTELDQTPVPEHATVKKRYDSLRGDLATLRLRNEARPKNDKTVKQLEELKVLLHKLESLHKSATLVQPMIGPTRDAFDQTFRAILKLELAKKELPDD